MVVGGIWACGIQSANKVPSGDNIRPPASRLQEDFLFQPAAPAMRFPSVLDRFLFAVCGFGLVVSLARLCDTLFKKVRKHIA